jgi:hypothetical protein
MRRFLAKCKKSEDVLYVVAESIPRFTEEYTGQFGPRYETSQPERHQARVIFAKCTTEHQTLKIYIFLQTKILLKGLCHQMNIFLKA